jgi:O-acetyl-ADP-ribose deacetylase (regulator of RNase III)
MPFEIVRNDITHMNVDAIVNAANPSLLGGGGVDGAIHRAAGPELLAECRGLGGCRTGEAKITGGYRLPIKYVIHTVGPVWRDGQHDEKRQLLSCYRNSLQLAREYGCESIAFPLISAGAYGYPKALALQAAIEAITGFLVENEMAVYMVVFGRDTVEISGRLLGDVEAYIDDVYVDEHLDGPREYSRFDMARSELVYEDACPAPIIEPRESLDDMLEQIDESFAQTLIRKIDERNITDAECYKRANVDRRLFNKIKNNPDYKPGKQTVLAFAIALELSLDETKDLLMKAGFALSRASRADIVVEYCIMNRIFDIVEINQVLFKLDLPLLGF